MSALAEILSIKDVNGTKMYYVHYIDCELVNMPPYNFIFYQYFWSKVNHGNCIFNSFADNKRLDEWVTEDRLDTRKVQYPGKDCTPANVAGLSTPKRTQTGISVTSSRPASPITFETNSDEPIINPAFSQLEQHKKIARRKKLNSCPQES